MQKRWHLLVAGLLAASLMGLAGCGEVKFEPQISSLFLNGNGSVVGAEIESFDNSGFSEVRYDPEELQAFVEDAVKNYNAEAGSPEAAYTEELEEKNGILPISIERLEVANNEAVLLLDYATCEDYMAFNKADESVTQLSVTSAPVAVASGVSLDGLVNEKGEAVDTTKARESEKYRVAVIAGNTTVVFNGKVLGYSGVELVDDHTVRVESAEPGCILFR